MSNATRKSYGKRRTENIKMKINLKTKLFGEKGEAINRNLK